MKPSEKNIMDAIIDLLRYENYLCWRVNVTGMRKPYTDKAGVTRNHYVQFNQPGMPDIMGIQPKTGRVIGIEVKRPVTRNKVTLWQKEWIERINAQGGIAFVACSPEEVCEKLGFKKLL